MLAVLTRFVTIPSKGAWKAVTWRYFSTKLLPSENSYRRWQISSQGRCCNSHGIVTTGYLSPCGYHKIKIGGHPFYIHRLVALAFLEPADPSAWQVHHRDGNKSNNSAENLEYVTPSQNQRYSHASGSRVSGAKLISKPVMWRPVGYEGWTSSPSMASAARDTGVSNDSVFRSCSKNVPVKGFVFQWRDDRGKPRPGEKWVPMLNPKTAAEVPGRMVSSAGRYTIIPNGMARCGTLTRQGYFVTYVQGSNFYVHRLVAFAFLGQPPSHKHIVNHKDLDKGNNAVDNLEYITVAENVLHFIHSSESGRKPTSNTKPVESRLKGSDGTWTWHSSIRAAAEACGVSRTTVSHQINECLNTAPHRRLEFRPAGSSKKPGEEWRDVDVKAHLEERLLRTTSV